MSLRWWASGSTLHFEEKASHHRSEHRMHPRISPERQFMVCGTSRSRKPLNPHAITHPVKSKVQNPAHNEHTRHRGEGLASVEHTKNTPGSTTERCRAEATLRKTPPPDMQHLRELSTDQRNDGGSNADLVGTACSTSHRRDPTPQSTYLVLRALRGEAPRGGWRSSRSENAPGSTAGRLRAEAALEQTPSRRSSHAISSALQHPRLYPTLEASR